jgi:division protein CdvB (Snf7/Vps24/ESCRT-III family)
MERGSVLVSRCDGAFLGGAHLVMASMDSLRIFRRGKGGGDYKGRIAVALREIEGQRKELDQLKARLSERRQKLFETTVRALQEKNKSKAAVYATEHAEVRKVARVVEASELALTQVSLRLQSITEIGDAMLHMDTAFRSLKQISKEMRGVIPALDAASTDINSTFVETMAQMGQISPNINIDIKTENTEDLVEQAKRYAEEQSARLKDSLNMMPGKFEEEIFQTSADDTPLLATGDEEENVVLGTIYSAPKDEKVEYEVLRYAATHEGALDISRTSQQLGIPQDLVEQSMIHLVAQGKVKPAPSRSSEQH